jgi:hypothetical protein
MYRPTPPLPGSIHPAHYPPRSCSITYMASFLHFIIILCVYTPLLILCADLSDQQINKTWVLLNSSTPPQNNPHHPIAPPYYPAILTFTHRNPFPCLRFCQIRSPVTPTRNWIVPLSSSDCCPSARSNRCPNYPTLLCIIRFIHKPHSQRWPLRHPVRLARRRWTVAGNRQSSRPHSPLSAIQELGDASGRQ